MMGISYPKQDFATTCHAALRTIETGCEKSGARPSMHYRSALRFFVSGAFAPRGVSPWRV
jgi:hypothetical protein